MSSNSASKAKVDAEVCADAEKLVRLYTDLADVNRTRISELYSAGVQPQLVWNGNPYIGKQAIAAFWQALPETTHDVICLDAHRIAPTSDEALVVLAMGTVSIGGVSHAFNQSLLLVLEQDTYKIQSDNYRVID